MFSSSAFLFTPEYILWGWRVKVLLLGPVLHRIRVSISKQLRSFNLGLNVELSSPPCVLPCQKFDLHTWNWASVCVTQDQRVVTEASWWMLGLLLCRRICSIAKLFWKTQIVTLSSVSPWKPDWGESEGSCNKLEDTRYLLPRGVIRIEAALAKALFPEREQDENVFGMQIVGFTCCSLALYLCLHCI